MIIAGVDDTIQYNTIQYNTIKIYLNTVKSFSTKKTKTDLQDCRVGVTIDILRISSGKLFHNRASS